MIAFEASPIFQFCMGICFALAVVFIFNFIIDKIFDFRN